MTERAGEPEQLRVVSTPNEHGHGVIAIGRAKDCHVCIPSGNASRRHCFLIVKPDGSMFIKDSGSTNGTWVNGRRVATPQPFGPSDRLYLGDRVIEVLGLPVPDEPWRIRLEVIDGDQVPRISTHALQCTADDRHELALGPCTLIINEAGGSWLLATPGAELVIDGRLAEAGPERFPVGAIARSGNLTLRLVEPPLGPPGFVDR
jgi:pSer/pThr/pTyr-binding forkhead associated (FHA) protein